MMPFRTAAMVTAIVAPLCMAAPFASVAMAQSTIKVVVNGEPITSNEIKERASFLRLVHRNFGAAELEKAATDELVEDRLKFAEGKRVGIEVKSEQVEGAFGNIAKGMKITPAQLAAGLGQQGVSVTTLKTRIRAQILWQRLVMGRFNRQVSIGESQIADALQKKAATPGATGTPSVNAVAEGTTTEYNMQQVTMVVPRTPAGAGAQRLKEAEALRAKVTSCDQLIEAAKGYRETVIKPLGKRTADEMPPQFRDVIGATDVGRLSKPVPTANAVEMVAVCEKRDIKGDFSVRSKVEDELRQEEGLLMARRYMTELRRIAVIDFK